MSARITIGGPALGAETPVGFAFAFRPRHRFSWAYTLEFFDAALLAARSATRVPASFRGLCADADRPRTQRRGDRAAGARRQFVVASPGRDSSVTVSKFFNWRCIAACNDVVSD